MVKQQTDKVPSVESSDECVWNKKKNEENRGFDVGWWKTGCGKEWILTTSTLKESTTSLK